MFWLRVLVDGPAHALMLQELGTLQLRVVLTGLTADVIFDAKQSFQRIENEYDLNANLFAHQPSKPL